MTTITKERLLKIQHWRETYGADSNVMLPAEEAAELARIALASLEVAPVGEVSEKRHGLVMDGTVDLGGKSTYRIIKGEKAMKRLPLGTKFYIAPPVPVVPPEKWVNPDINYAEENGFAEGWNACRAAMLQGSQPVSQTYKLPELIEGMEVSIDVSTCDADAGNRYFGTVTEVSELDTAKNGYILLVQDAKPNFDVNGNSPVIPEGSFSGLVNSARALLDVLYEFGADEVAISEYVTNLEDALRVAAAPQQ